MHVTSEDNEDIILNPQTANVYIPMQQIGTLFVFITNTIILDVFINNLKLCMTPVVSVLLYACHCIFY